jgi:putative ABC transport system permease protein
MKPHMGRGFTAEEIERREPVAILSYRVWRQRFGGDPGVVGGPIIINGKPRTLVGIMPPRLLLIDTDLWLPMWAGREELPRSRRQLTVLARIKDGLDLEAVNTELDIVARRIEQEYGDEAREYKGWHLGATPLVGAWRQLVGPAGTILLAAVGFVLLIACANIAGLLLARGATRRREMAVRTAVGAGRGRLLRQLLTESSLIALLGGALGVVVAYWAVQYAVALAPVERIPAGIEIALNSRALLFTFAVSVFCGLFFGLAPAIQGSRVELLETLNADSGRTGTGRRAGFLRRVFVVAEIALSLVLLAGAGLMIRSFNQLQGVDPGVDTDKVLTMRVTLAWERFSEEAMKNFFNRLLDEVEQIPGARSAALASQFPPNVRLDRKFQIAGRAQEAEGTLPNADVTVASPSLFSTLGMSLLKGRELTDRDTMDAPPVAVVNTTLARRFFPGDDPVGKRIKLGGADSESPWRTIVGVVSDTRNHGLDADAAPELFVSYKQNRASNQLFLLVRTEAGPKALLPAVRAVVRSIDPDQPVYAISTLEEIFAADTAPRRIASMGLIVLAAIALGLASLGIYGVMSYTVNEQAREIGIRMALGAKGSTLLGWITRKAFILVAIGVSLGLAGVFAVTRTMGRLLYNVSPMDPITLTTVVLVLGGVALLASFLPAWRAMRLDPVEVLRKQ